MNLSHNQIDKFYAFIFWLSGIFACSILYIFDYNQLSGVKLTFQNIMVGRDFFNVWSGGILASTGHEEIIYDHVKYLEWQNTIFPPIEFYNYSYPPHSILLAIPFGQLSYPFALAVWTIFGAIFFYFSARRYIPETMPPILALLTPAALINMWAGHYGFLIGGLWLLFFSSLSHKPTRAGIYAGLLTLKPHLGLLIAVVLLVKQSWRTIATAIVTTALLILASGLAFGFELWLQWIVDTSALQAQIMSVDFEPFYYRMMTSTYVALRYFDPWVAVTGQLITAGGAFYLFWVARNAHYSDLAFIAASSTMLIVPYAFNYDLTVVTLGFGVLLFKRWPHLSAAERCCIWLAFVTPILVMTKLFFAPLALLVGLFIQVRHAVPEWLYSAERT